MTDADCTLIHRVADSLARWLTHAAFLSAVLGLVTLSYPQIAGRASVAPGAERVSAGSAVSVRAQSAAQAPDLHTPASSMSLDAGDDVDAFVGPVAQAALPLAGVGALFKSPQLQTIIPKRPRKELVIHTVKQGDNLSTIAEVYDVDVDTLIWANGDLEEDPDYVVVGQKLTIPPVSGVLYTIKTGDTLDAVATKYKGDLRTMQELEFNHLSDAVTTPISGTQIMIPGGEKEYQPRLVYIAGRAVMVNAPRGGGRFVWPAQGYISTFWEPDHRAVDIAGPEGSPIYASDAGVVTYSGWNGTYGIMVTIDHGNGFETLYAHLSTYYPVTGQNVRRGQAVGKMGNTGKSTGPHLHFEIRYQGGNVNPMRYLPQ
jgi:murein DD-endopeptidase MepM/ murein hydrolase activator NlpD